MQALVRQGAQRVPAHTAHTGGRGGGDSAGMCLPTIWGISTIGNKVTINIDIYI